MKKDPNDRNRAPFKTSATSIRYLFVVAFVLTGGLLTWFLLSRPAETAAPLAILRIPERPSVPQVLPKVTVRTEPEVDGKPVDILMVGDVMPGRYVETLMQRNGPDYPFAKLDGLLDGHDIVFGNLEGPIDSTHGQTPDDSLIFSFDASIAQTLRNQGFTMLSLANNHTLNQGASELEFTRSELQKAGIDALGDPSKSSDATLVQKTINGHAMAFFGFHATTPAFDLEASKNLVLNICTNVQRFCIIFIHWGNEYQLRSSARQQSIAHTLIDAGADAIVGHHPHVVQEIESYRGTTIFYSLGNFIFDQYFSPETQEGLGVELLVTESGVTYALHPLRSIRSQPAPMAADATSAWLTALAARSSPELSTSIASGILKQDR